MSVKYTCDSCEQEITHNRKKFDIPCHIFSGAGNLGYVDRDGIGTSGRMDSVDLCNKCWNVAYYAAKESLNLK